MLRTSQGNAYYMSRDPSTLADADPDNDWAPFKQGFTFSGSKGVVMNNIEINDARWGLVLYDHDNEVTVNNLLINGNNDSVSKGIYIVPTTTNPGEQDLSFTGTFAMDNVQTGIHIIDILSSPNDIILDSSFDAVNIGSNITIGIEREGAGSVIGLPSFASDLGFNNFTAGTPEFYNP
jgi:hypothetical protein